MSAGHTPRSFVLASHGGSAGAGAAPPATHAASCSDAWPGNSPDAHPASSMAMVPDRSWARSPGPSAACGAGTGGHGASATKVPGWGDTPRLTREAPPDRDRSGSHWPAAPSWGIDDTPGLSAVAACGATVPAVTVPSLGPRWPGTDLGWYPYLAMASCCFRRRILWWVGRRGKHAVLQGRQFAGGLLPT